MMKLIYRGAEAELWKKDYMGMLVVEKRRLQKKYRIPEIDGSIRKRRAKTECSAIIKSRAAVSTPRIFDIDLNKKSFLLEFIDGEKVRDLFLRGEKIDISKNIGAAVRSLHGAEIIHGDLTTSNMIFKNGLYFIDFGLSFKSKKIEDRATDILVFKKMLRSTHFKHFDQIWRGFCAGYADALVLERADAIEKRARYVER